MRIRITDSNLGECIININGSIGKSQEYAIKSLCMLQIMCMNSQGSDPRFKEFIKILKETTEKAAELYSPEGENDADPFQHFNANNF